MDLTPDQIKTISTVIEQVLAGMYPPIPVVAGWAKPLNQPDDLVHWWRPDHRRACDPNSRLRFQGERSTSMPADVCLDCAIAVRDAAAVLGYPTS